MSLRRKARILKPEVETFAFWRSCGRFTIGKTEGGERLPLAEREHNDDPTMGQELTGFHFYHYHLYMKVLYVSSDPELRSSGSVLPA